jgi:hypothetical protein
MYYLVTILLIIMGFIFTLLMFLSKRETPIFGMLALICWFVTSATVAVMDVPYTYTYENGADIVAVEEMYTLPETHSLSWFFLGLGFLCFIYIFVVVFRDYMIPYFRGRKGQGGGMM